MFKVFSNPKEHSISWWREQYQNGRLEMEPPYQRRSGIWAKWKQAHLIDSLINDFDVPKFYFADFTRFPTSKLNRTKKPFAVVDGKQRLQAIFDFLDGDFVLNPSSIYEDREVSVAGFDFQRLTQRFPEAADKILNFVPSIMYVVTDEEERIKEMFVRLNSGEHVTGAEKRNSMEGPIPDVIRELSVHPFFSRNIKFATLRMQDLNLIAKLLLIEDRGKFVDTKKGNLDDLAKNAHRQYQDASNAEVVELDEYYRRLQQKVFAVLDRMSSVFVEKDPLLANQGSIPVYYWLIKHSNVAKRKRIREFLMYMVEAVKDARAAQKDDPDNADQELALYYTLGRTTNDVQSLNGRYEILSKRFDDWLDAGN